jgi:hypothetical protein
MRKINLLMVILWLGIGGILIVLSATQARAVPSFARQTGMSCNTCHTVFPELTPFGRHFKLTGFTMSKNKKKPYEWPPPVAGMVQLSFTHHNKSMPATTGAAGGFGFTFEPSNRANDNVNVPQAISLFYGGRIYDEHVGGLIQGTYDGVANKFFLDNTDVRFVVTPELFSKPLILGLTVNNNPTVSDVLNTTPAWGFPAAAPAGDNALTPSAGPQIEGALAQQVGGIGGYLFWNNLVYGEMALYCTARKGPTQLLGAGSVTDPTIQDVAPYWRVFLQHQWGKHSLAVGHYGLVNRNLSPSPKPPAVDQFGNPIPGNPNLIDTRGPVDRCTDLGFDAQYQFIGRKHILTTQTSYIHEDQRLNDTFSQGGSLSNANWLDKYKINLNYYYRTDNWGTIGGTIAYNSIWGKWDPLLYAPGAGTGSRTGKPNSDWWVFELDYVPWWKQFITKITLQCTVYSHFNGARSLYDGNAGASALTPPSDTFPYSRRNASANNSLYLLIWQTF